MAQVGDIIIMHDESSAVVVKIHKPHSLELTEMYTVLASDGSRILIHDFQIKKFIKKEEYDHDEC